MSFEQTVIDFLKKKIPELKGIYLFGSHADGTANEESDFDIAYLTERPLPPDAVVCYQMAAALGELLGGNVDLIDLQNASIDFRFQIISTARRIYCSDKTHCGYFEMTTYSMYQRFEEERKPIIEDIKKRGQIYG